MNHAELCTIADTIERNGGWHIAALKVRAAADEIERLTRELDDAKANYERIHRMYVDAKYPESAVTNVKALEAERDRLRAAMGDALAYTEHVPDDSMPTLRKQLNQIARVCDEALAGAADETRRK